MGYIFKRGFRRSRSSLWIELTLATACFILTSSAVQGENDEENTVEATRGDLNEEFKDELNTNLTSTTQEALGSSVTPQSEGEGTLSPTNDSITVSTSSESPTPTTQPPSNTTFAKPSPDEKQKARALAYKCMGSLVMAYFLICIYMAIKNGPVFTY